MKRTEKFSTIFVKSKQERELVSREPSVESIAEEREPSPEPQPKKVAKLEKKVSFKE